MPERKILIADNEPDILEMLEYALQKEGFVVIKAVDGEEALRKAEQHLPRFILLDVMMPKIDGIEVCRRLRMDSRFQDTIVMILTARLEEYSEIAGFEAGADDYVTKPVRLRSLIHRIQALAKRKGAQTMGITRIGPFEIDREKFILIKDGVEIKLPKKEFELVGLLAGMEGRVVTREKIFEQIWGNDVVVVDRTIDVHIRRIRMKIGENHIQTFKGVGYKFVAEPTEIVD